MPPTARVVIQAGVDTHSGFGQLFCEVFSGLTRRGVDVAVRPVYVAETFDTIPLVIREQFVYSVQPEEWELLIMPLGPGLHPTPGKKTVYWSMWETDALGKKQVSMLSRAHAIIVPSTWAKQCFRDYGIQAPIYVVPLGISPEIFSYREPDVSLPCTFMTAGRFLNPSIERKGVAPILRAFNRAFKGRPDVKLSVKTFPDVDAGFVAKLPLNIEVIRQHWTWDTLLHWLMRGTAFVHAAHEGWGLMQHQAMAVGRPLIGPIWGAMGDYVTPTNSYPVKHHLEDAGEYYQTISGGRWPVMDEQHLAEEMRRIYFDRVEAVGKGMQAASDVRMLTWDNTVEKLLEVLDELGVMDPPEEAHALV